MILGKAIGGLQYIEDILFPMVEALHLCPDKNSFTKLKDAFFRQLYSEGQNTLAEYLETEFFSDEWVAWYVGSAPIKGIGLTSNPIEAVNKMIQLLVCCS
jgi:hypothetical protein